AQTMLSDVVESSKTGRQSGLTNISDVLGEWVIDVEERFKDPDAHRGLKTGIAPLDAMLAPKFIVRGSLFVVGARPKMGKTTVLTEMAKNVSDSGLPVALFSMEMTNKQLAERMISQKSGISSNALYDSGDEYEWGLISKAMGELSDRPNIWLDDTPGMTLAHIQAECRKLKRKTGKIGFIGVDYLTLMKAGKADRNDIAYGEITKGLKQLAKELDTTIVLLTQLNRKLEDRADKRPMPSDSRDTGQIEQDCDYWLGIYKDSVYNDNADKTLTELIMRLNRHGKAGTAYVEQKGLCMFDIDQTQAMVRAEPPARHNPRQKDF
uniref:DnaB helicase C-terminal domain-containing protein n=1 Tax=Morganella morganii TaxID=582 RepID=UPI002368A34E